MKIILSILLSLSLVSCSSTREAPEARPYTPATIDELHGATYCGTGIECVAVWFLIYGSIATVRFIKEGVSSLTRFSDSNPSAIVIKCQIQTPNRQFVRPCGTFTVDMFEKETGKTRTYNFTGYDNQINIVKGKNKISVKLSECGLTQVADQVKTGDVLNLEYPPECHKENKI